ncbi:hypothetical protein J4440_06195 [Candidatus Woesearchaeota archaeon]|nr:hypothetical protein [Candidatus Woesearchaeota archaeon]
MESKSISYKDEKGEKYKISWSEELQLKNLHTAKKQVYWLKLNFLMKLGLTLVMFGLLVVVVYTLWVLSNVDFFTRVAFR